MISGKRPYSAGTLNALRQEHISVSPPPLSEKVAGVSKAFSDVISRAISKDRGDRQATAGELAAQLRSALLETPETARADKAPPDKDVVAAETLKIPAAINTRSDVEAPTIITMDVMPTTPPRAGLPESPAAVGSFQPYQTPPDPMASSETVLRPQAKVGSAAPQESRGKPFILIGAGVLILLLAVVGLGGFFAVNWLKTRPVQPDKRETGATQPEVANDPPGKETSATGEEVANYWLEVLPSALSVQTTQVAGTVPLASGQAFKFHFKFKESGYLYIIGPGEGNRLTAFLTSQPAEISGLDNNQITKGGDFSFPEWQSNIGWN